MKVLLLGNDKFIAEALIRRFLIEKDKIVLLGRINDGINEALLKRIQYYDMDVSSSKVEDVFIVNSPDVVIYFNDAQKNLNEEMSSKESFLHINSMVNTHYFAVRGKIKKYVYISTTDLEEEKDLMQNFWLNSHNVCEGFLKTIEMTKTTQNIILRASKIYGKGQSEKHCNICKQVYSRIYETKLENLDDQPQDYIHIDDFTDAVAKSLTCKESDSFNIASGYKVTPETVTALLDRNDNLDKEWFDSKKLESVDISHAKEVFDYSPFVNMHKQIKTLYAEAYEESLVDNKGNFKFSFKKLIKKLNEKGQEVIDATPYLVTVFLFLLTVYFTIHQDMPTLFGYIDLKILCILIVALMFKLNHAVISIILCSLLLVYQYSLEEESTILLIYNAKMFRDIFILMVFGLAAGVFRDRYRTSMIELERNDESLRNQLAHVKKMFYDSIKVKDSLEDQVYNSSNSYGRVFSVISQLNSLEFSQLKLAVIKAAEEILENKSLSLYMFDGNKTHLRLISKSKDLQGCSNSIEATQSEAIQIVLKNKNIFVNKDLNSKENFGMVAPVIDHGDDVIAVLIMHNANVERLTLSYVNLVKVTVSLINQAIVRAYLYEKAQEDKWYIENTNVLKEEFFLEKILHHTEMKREAGIPYSILEVTSKLTETLMKQIPGLIREFDFVGLSKDGKLRILLNNVSSDEIIFVQSRLFDNHVKTKAIEVD